MAKVEIEKTVGNYLEKGDDYRLDEYTDGLELFCLNAGEEVQG